MGQKLILSDKKIYIISLILVFSLMLFLVAGCSGGTTTEKKEGSTVESSKETKAEQAEGVEVEGEEEGPATIQEKVQNERLADIKDVKQLYIDNCGACHGHDGSGVVGPNIKDSQLTTAEVKSVVDNGIKRPDGSELMPKFKGGELTEEQIQKIVDYVVNEL